MNDREPLWKAIFTGSWVKRFVDVPAKPVPLWRRAVGALIGVALLAAMIVLVGRYSGLPRKQLDDWGETLVIAPFLIAGVVVLYMRRRRRP